MQAASYMLNRRAPRTQRSRSGLTVLSRHSVRTYQGNDLTRNSSGNACPQSFGWSRLKGGGGRNRRQSLLPSLLHAGKKPSSLLGKVIFIPHTLFFFFFLYVCPRGLTFTWWECCGLCLWHKPTELAHSFWLFFFFFWVCFCLNGPFSCIAFYKLSRQLSAFSLCSSGFVFCLIGPFKYIYLYESLPLSPDVILCGWLGLKHQLTN